MPSFIMLLAQDPQKVSGGMKFLGLIIGLAIAGWFLIWFVNHEQALDAKKAADKKVVGTLTCPTCHRTGGVRRIPGAERVASGVAGGLLFSKKARANFQCTLCKYVW